MNSVLPFDTEIKNLRTVKLFFQRSFSNKRLNIAILATLIASLMIWLISKELNDEKRKYPDAFPTADSTR